jgi:lanosterol synthase
MTGGTINITHTPTDRTRWRLRVDQGKQTWHYLSEEEIKANPQTNTDKYWLNLKLVIMTCQTCTTPLPQSLRSIPYTF